MADGGGAYVMGAAQIALQATAMAATGVATGMKIDETIQDYQDQIKEASAKKQAMQAQGKAEMVDAGKALQYQAGMAMQQGALQTGAAQASAGFSGVKGQSPLMAIAQTARMAGEATAETVRAGNANLKGMGMQYTALTGDYNRAMELYRGKQQYLRNNKGKMVALASIGGAVDLGNTIINVGMRDWGWGNKTSPTVAGGSLNNYGTGGSQWAAGWRSQ